MLRPAKVTVLLLVQLLFAGVVNPMLGGFATVTERVACEELPLVLHEMYHVCAPSANEEFAVITVCVAFVTELFVP